MEMGNNDLRMKYMSLNDDEIISLYDPQELTDEALLIVQEEIKRRNLTVRANNNLEENKRKKWYQYQKNLFGLPTVWSGFIFAFLLMISETQAGSGDEVVISYIIGMFSFLYWLFCVDRFHRALGKLSEGNYKISPNNAVLIHLAPLYNLFWIVYWPNELTKFINKRGNSKMIPGYIIGVLFLISLIIMGFSIALGTFFIYCFTLYIKQKLKDELLIEMPVSP